MVSVAVGWQLYERTGSAFALGLTGLVQVLPVFALTFVAGPLVDRSVRRNVAAAAECLFLSCALGLALASYASASVAVIYCCLFGMGIARAFSAPAISSMLPTLVARENFVNANAYVSSAFELASIAGPAIAGGIIWWSGGATAVYAIYSLLSATFLSLLVSLPGAPPVAGKAGSPREGFFFLRKTPVLLAAILLDTFAVLLGGATALLPIFAKDILHVGPAGLGWLRAAPSFGAVTMAIITTRLAPWKRPGVALLVTVVGFGASMIAFGLSHSFTLSMLALVASGAFDNISVVIRLSLEQLLTPERLRGRVSAVHYVFIGASNELGSFESGLTAAWVGPVMSVVGGGIGTMLVVAVVVVIFPQLARSQPLHEIELS